MMHDGHLIDSRDPNPVVADCSHNTSNKSSMSILVLYIIICGPVRIIGSKDVIFDACMHFQVDSSRVYQLHADQSQVAEV